VPPPNEPRTLNLAGLRLPLRETVVVMVTTLVLVVDWYHPLWVGTSPDLSVGLARLALFLAVPILTLLLLHQRLTDYGLRIGDWRIGLPFVLALAALVTPIVVLVSGLPDFNLYYRHDPAALPGAVLGNVLSVGAAEFLFRGFLMWTLIGIAGPSGVAWPPSRSSSPTSASQSWRPFRPSSVGWPSDGSPGGPDRSCTAPCCTPT